MTGARIAALTLGLVVGLPAEQELRSEGPLSPRNANYTIEVELDPETRMLDGRQLLVWRNIQERPTGELWFHLYWNAWRNNRSSWMIEPSVPVR